MAALIETRLRTRFVAALVALVLLAPAGCTNPFQPATPEAPLGASVPENFKSRDGVLQTIQAAIAAQSPAGSVAYMHALAESTSSTTHEFYAFHSDSVVLAWRPSSQHDPPAIWGRALESHLYDYLTGEVAQGQSLAMVFTTDPDSPNPEIDEVAGTALIHQHYVLQRYNADGSRLEIVAVGNADLSMYRVNGNWSIYRWQDRLDPQYGVNPSPTERRSMSWRRLDSLSH